MQANLYSCVYCNKCFKDQYYFDKHIESFHADKEKPVDDIITIEDDFENSINTALNETATGTCYKRKKTSDVGENKITTTNSSKFKTNLQTAQNGPGRPHSWMTISESQRRAQILPKQINAHILASWNCIKCEFTCLTKAGLEQHVKKDHPVLEQALICSACSNKFPTYIDFMSHLQSCNKPKDIHILFCGLCQNQFSSRIEFNRHTELHHPEVSSLPTRMPHSITIESLCGQCDQRFINKEDLKGHLQAKHAVSCPHCEDTFTDPSSHQEHLRSTHMCLYCGFYGAGQVLDAHKQVFKIST